MTVHKNYRWGITSVYSAAHFLIDFACAFLMFRSIVAAPSRSLCVLLYNFCAFAMQMPIGVIADVLRRNALLAVTGCALVASAYGLAVFPVVAAVTAGIGNSLFHLGGGIEVLSISEERMSALGVFVSPGAFGIYFGTLLGKGNALGIAPVVAALLAAAVAICFYPGVRVSARSQSSGAGETVSRNYTLPPGSARYAVAAAALLLPVVCVRSFAGLAISFPWKVGLLPGVLLTCAVVFGKAGGGFLADRFSPAKTSILSLGLCVPLFFFPAIPAAGIVSMFLFNMTMPITLWAVAKAFPGAKGFSFGLLTFGLFLGYLPVHFGAGVPDGASWFFPLAALVSLALLLGGLKVAGKCGANPATDDGEALTQIPILRARRGAGPEFPKER